MIIMLKLAVIRCRSQYGLPSLTQIVLPVIRLMLSLSVAFQLTSVHCVTEAKFCAGS